MKGGYLINQRQYIIELLINTGMTNCNTVSTPMTKSLSGEDSVLFENITLYETVLGKLNYISRYSRPDIGYAVSRLYQSVKAPTTADWQRVKRVLRYLKSTLDHGVLITASTDNLITCFADADFSGNTESRSTTGYVLFHNNNPIIWKSAIQHKVAQSTMEAEYYSCAESAKEVIWLRKLMMEFFPSHAYAATTLYEDNEACISFINGNAKYHSRSKHIDRRHYFVKSEVDGGVLQLCPISSADNTADIFTKPLGATLFKKHREGLCATNDK